MCEIDNWIKLRKYNESVVKELVKCNSKDLNKD